MTVLFLVVWVTFILFSIVAVLDWRRRWWGDSLGQIGRYLGEASTYGEEQKKITPGPPHSTCGHCDRSCRGPPTTVDLWTDQGAAYSLRSNSASKSRHRRNLAASIPRSLQLMTFWPLRSTFPGLHSAWLCCRSLHIIRTMLGMKREEWMLSCALWLGANHTSTL